MTKREADTIAQAITLIETGRGEQGVSKLRVLLAGSGTKPPPPIVIVDKRKART